MPENYNLTPEQGKIWQIQKAWDGTDICNVGGILRLSGKEDADILARAVGIYVQTQSAFWLRMNRHGKQYFEQIFPYGNRDTRSTSRTGKHGKCIDQH